MKKKILYLALAAITSVSISVTSCSSSKKVDTIRQDSIKESDSTHQPDAAKIKKDSV